MALAVFPVISLAGGAEERGRILTRELTQAAPASTRHDARVVVASYVEVIPSSDSAASTLLTTYREASRKEDGNLSLEVLRHNGRSGHFAVVESWRDERAFTEHRRSAHARQFLEKLRPHLVSPYDERMHTSVTMGATSAAPAGTAVWVVTHVDVIPPGQNDIGPALTALAEASRKEPGNVRFDVLVGVRPNHFTVLETWRDERAREAHVAAAHTRRFREELYPRALNGSPYDERLYQALAP